MSFGIVPEGNLTAWLFGLVLFATRVNLGIGMLTAMAVTAVSPIVDPLTHAFGLWLLSLEFVKSLLIRWYDAAFVPWLRLNNTVVLSSTALGLLLLYPIQHISQRVASSLAPRLKQSFSHGTNTKVVNEPAPSDLPAVVQEALQQVTFRTA